MNRLLISLYGFAFFNKFLLLNPLYAIFMQQNGLSDLQLSTMFIVFALGTVLTQAPVTYITNRMGQRRAMLIGQTIKAMTMLLWLSVPTYAGFVTGMFMWGIQGGFRSVAFEGLVYDSVAAYGKKRDYPRILGRKATYESIGTALSALGSLLMFMGYAWVTWASVAAILISMICLVAVPYSPKTKVSKAKVVPMRKLMRTGIKVCMKTPCLVSLMMLTLLVINVPYLDDFLSPIGLQIGVPTEYVGIMSLFLLGCAIIGQRYAYKFVKISDAVLYGLIGLVGVALIGFGVDYDTDALWMLGVAYMLFYGIYTVLYSRFQNMIPPRHRSVVLSVYTTINYILYMIVCGIIGLGTTLGSWRYSIFILGGLMIVLGLWSIAFMRNRCSAPQA